MGFTEEHQAYTDRLSGALSTINDLELARKRLTYMRWKVAENLDKLLFEFETNVKKNDAGILWCPDHSSALENLNKHLKAVQKVRFLKHNAVRHFVNELDLKLPAESDEPEVLVMGAKFIMANTGNFYTAFSSLEEYEMMLKAKKIIVIAGIDSVLALQSELSIARHLYSVFETGHLSYEAGMLSRPGRVRGLQSEIVLLLTDLGKSNLLELPVHRPLFSLLNFDLPPVCPMQALSYDPESWKKQDTLSYVSYAFMHGLKEYRRHIEGNYGLKLLNRYLPYDIDLYEQILDARALLHQEDRSSLIDRLRDADRSSVALQAKKFADAGKFHKYAERNFFGHF